jgi:hypothetical protein
VEKKGEKITRVKYSESIADKLGKGSWSWSRISAIDYYGRTTVLLKLPSSLASTSLPMPRMESDKHPS